MFSKMLALAAAVAPFAAAQSYPPPSVGYRLAFIPTFTENPIFAGLLSKSVPSGSGENAIVGTRDPRGTLEYYFANGHLYQYNGNTTAPYAIGLSDSHPASDAPSQYYDVTADTSAGTTGFSRDPATGLVNYDGETVPDFGTFALCLVDGISSYNHTAIELVYRNTTSTPEVFRCSDVRIDAVPF